MELSFLDLARRRMASQTSAATFEGLAQVRGYWEALRTGPNLPLRSAIDPRGLSGMLDRVFVAERIGRGVAQVRIAGSGLTDLAGTELRGLPLCCLFSSESRPGFATLIEEVCSHPAAAEADLTLDVGHRAMQARMILLPLDDEMDRRLVLGAISFATGPTVRSKFRLGRCQIERLSPPQAPPEPPVPPMSAAHLRLVHSRAE